jgi:hypothetical protein
MSKIYKSAMGKPVDMDMLRLSNEEVIAVGNMRTNARGDQLGKGGKVVKSRSEIMREYHKLLWQKIYQLVHLLMQLHQKI